MPPGIGAHGAVGLAATAADLGTLCVLVYVFGIDDRLEVLDDLRDGDVDVGVNEGDAASGWHFTKNPQLPIWLLALFCVICLGLAIYLSGLQTGAAMSVEFVAKDPGAFMVHCGTPPVLMHIAQGMYLPIIVDPSHATGRPDLLGPDQRHDAERPLGVYDTAERHDTQRERCKPRF